MPSDASQYTPVAGPEIIEPFELAGDSVTVAGGGSGVFATAEYAFTIPAPHPVQPDGNALAVDWIRLLT